MVEIDPEAKEEQTNEKLRITLKARGIMGAKRGYYRIFDVGTRAARNKRRIIRSTIDRVLYPWRLRPTRDRYCISELSRKRTHGTDLSEMAAGDGLQLCKQQLGLR